MDSLEKQKDYMVLSFIQSAYDNDMAILKASETYASRYACFKILVNAMGTKMVSSFEENGRSRTLLDKLKKHTCTKNSITFSNNNGCC
jgi:hypothetical protein